jgi:hypothetical protein
MALFQRSELGGPGGIDGCPGELGATGAGVSGGGRVLAEPNRSLEG